MKFYKGFWAAVYIESGEIRSVTYAEDAEEAKALLFAYCTDRQKALLKVEPVDVTVKWVDHYKIKNGTWVEHVGNNTVQVLASETHGQGLVRFLDGDVERTSTVVHFLEHYARQSER